MDPTVELLEGLARTYGYVGIFAISIIGSAVPFLPLPYLFVVVLLSNVLDPIYLGLAAGLGGALGKLTSYAIGRFGYTLLRERTKQRLDIVKRVIGKYGAVGVFIFALTPLPDDIYVIPMGMMRLEFIQFFTALLAGKVLLALFVALAGKYYIVTIELFTGESLLTATLVGAVGLLVVTILLLRVDWELFVTVAREGGIKGVISNLSRILSLKSR
ncbi:MAG: VTT domain-containing protein [Aigarchaeota archaeon]|nr:VTT domain-containing protein [Aigarchaeota archaeon]MDW8092331.1 VTT domain-containing protein [Nitrososphaerota archaeon]